MPQLASDHHGMLAEPQNPADIILLPPGDSQTLSGRAQQGQAHQHISRREQGCQWPLSGQAKRAAKQADDSTS
jgi:hypothetical protein